MADETSHKLIPKCDYLIKIGAPPLLENIFAWSPYLAQRPEEFVPYEGELPQPDEPPVPVEPDSLPKDVDPARYKMELLVEAIGELDEDDGFTAKGVPKIDALEGILGMPVTASERDDAWEAFNEK